MGWLKDMFGEGSSDPDHWNKKFNERMAKEQKEKDEIFDMSKNVDQINERSNNNAIEYRLAQKAEREQEVEEEKKKEEKAADDVKLVIDTAKLQCELCTNPIGDLKVNFRTPTIQGKKTATVKEKDMKSLIFKGNCKKSPQSSSPCASVMKLGDWKDIGAVKVQGQFPLLLKSTIKCNYGGADIKITDCGQRNEPSDIEAVQKTTGKITEMYWTYGDTKLSDKSKFYVDMNLIVKTENYDPGEQIVIRIKNDDGKPLTDERNELIFSGTVGEDNRVIFEEILKKFTLNILDKDDSDDDLDTEQEITNTNQV
jgi:hypothetical protein